MAQYFSIKQPINIFTKYYLGEEENAAKVANAKIL